MTNPCYKCIVRELHCHSNCSEYIEFGIQAEKLRQQRHNVIVSKGIVVDSVRRSRDNKKGSTIIKG